MTNNSAASSRVRLGIFFAVLFAIFGLAACGGGGGGSPTSVDGVWSEWGECSVTTCGITGTQARTCTNPAPSNGGADCSGSASQSCSTACEILTYTLSLVNSGGGTITSTPPGIDCDTGNCSADFNAGTLVTLSRVTDQGYSFIGWGGDCTVIGNECITTMSQAGSVSATFGIIVDGGWSAWGPCSVTACGLVGTQTRTCTNPTPANGGAICPGSASQSCSTPACAVTTYPLSLINGGNGTVTSVPAGISCTTNCSADFNDGLSVTLTAVPNYGYSFSGWSGACTGTDTCTTIMSAARNVTANFSATTFTITATAGANGTVLPLGTAGITTVNQGGSQTYTITPASGYNINTLTVDGTSVPLASSYSFTNVQGNRTISAIFAPISVGGNPISISLVPSRTSGVAPLSVFFDASGTTEVSGNSFHDIEYTWDFGDPTAGIWANGAQPGGPGISSKNSATGPVAAHVFETPGTYTVTLNAFNGTNTATTTTTITVGDPEVVFAGANTVCIGATAVPTTGANGCPTGAQVFMQPNFATAVNTYALTNRRVLFKRGDTFTAPTSGALTRTGPGIVGAFGATGGLPIVQMTGTGVNAGAILNLSSGSTQTIKDWRIMDFEFDGLNTTNTVGVGTGGGISQVLVLNMNMHNINEGVKFSDSVLRYLYGIGHTDITLFDEMAVVGSTITAIPGFADGSRIFAGSKRLSIQGNSLGNFTGGVQGNHVVRITHTEKGVISNNTLSKAHSTGHIIKLHGPTWCDPSSPVGQCISPETGGQTANYNYTVNTHPIGIFRAPNGQTKQVIISDNKFIGGIGAWTIGLGPQSAGHDERVQDVIVERNWFVAGTGTQVAALFWTIDTTVRNNICDMTGALWHTCFRVIQRGKEPPPDNVRVYNNTFYSSSTGDFYGVNIGSTATNVTVMNNLGSAPSATGPVMISGTGASGSVQSNNLLNNTPSSLFVTGAPVNTADFILKSLPNPARDIVIQEMNVFSDFLRTARPQGSLNDVGAIEGQ